MSESEVKRLARERAGMKCTACDTTNEQNIAKWGRSLHVHRVVPGSAYTLDGVIVYCTRCHWVIGHNSSEPKEPSKPPRAPRGNTKVRSFRLDEATLSDLDEIAEYHTATTGVKHSRTDALRVAVKAEVDIFRDADNSSDVS